MLRPVDLASGPDASLRESRRVLLLPNGSAFLECSHPLPAPRLSTLFPRLPFGIEGGVQCFGVPTKNLFLCDDGKLKPFGIRFHKTGNETFRAPAEPQQHLQYAVALTDGLGRDSSNRR
jgi:hypothetical protein